MTYQCGTCNYKTDKHFNFLKHQNRKTPCYMDYCVDDTVKNDPRECNNCGKLFINDSQFESTSQCVWGRCIRVLFVKKPSVQNTDCISIVVTRIVT